MATVKGMTPEEILANIAETITGGIVDGAGDLILSTKDGSVYNAGHVQGPEGPDGPQGIQGPIGTRWGTTTAWLFAGVTNVPVSFPDGQPPRINDIVVSTNSFGLGDVAKVTAVVDATHADVQYMYNIRGPAYTPTDSGWIDVTFSNGWTHYDTPRHAQVRKIDKQVTYRGLMKSGTIGSGVTAFAVPAGYQPQATLYADRHFLVVTNPYVTGVIQANAASRTFEVVNGSNTWIDLSMIQYSTA